MIDLALWLGYVTIVASELLVIVTLVWVTMFGSPNSRKPRCRR